MYVDPDPECEEDGWGAVRSAVVPAVAIAAYGGAYLGTYGLDRYLRYTEFLGPHGDVLQFGVLVGLIALHEAIHAVAYATVGGLSWDEIEVDVAVDLGDGYDPLHHSVHPARPIRRWVYYAGVAAPGIVLGIVPATVALVTGNPLAMYVGAIGLLLFSTDVAPLISAWRNPDTAAVSETAH